MEEALKNAKLKSRFRLYDLRQGSVRGRLWQELTSQRWRSSWGTPTSRSRCGTFTPHRSTSKRRFENWSVQRRTSVRDARKAVGVPTVRECPKRAADGSGCAI